MTPKRHIIPVFIPHEGCKHACVFCNQRMISGTEGAASIKKVHAAISTLSSADFPAELAFYGGSFTALPEKRQDELLEAAKPFLASGANRSIRISTRPDCIDESTLVRLTKAGVETVELGVQSMCDDVLSLAKRGHAAADAIRAAELVKQSGLYLILQMMTGLPGDTAAKSLFTARRLIALKPDGVRIYPTVVVGGTELYNMWRAGQYAEHTVEEAVELCAQVCALFRDAGIPVIRLGLNPTDELSAGDAIAGAYHPAFGDLVYSRMYYNMAAELLNHVPHGSSVIITVPKGRISTMIGQKRENIIKLQNEFSLREIKVVESMQQRAEQSVEVSI